MKRETDLELRSDEREAIDGLRRETSPPPGLEEDTVQILKDRHLIVPESDSGWFRPAALAGSVPFLLVVSIVVLIGAGFGLGYWTGARGGASTEADMRSGDFLLVLWEFPAREEGLSADEINRRIGEYSRWASDARENGHLIGGEKLTEEIGILRRSDGRLGLEEKRFGGVERGIAGYFLIRAEDYRQALQIAKGCPHLKYGGEIEVRGIERL